MTYNTLKEACEAWVESFDRVPSSVLEKLMDYDGSVEEITPPSMCDRVSIIFEEHAGETGEVIETNVDDTDGLYKVKLDNGEVIEKYGDELEVIEQESWLPIWSTLWSFGDLIDEEWLMGKFEKPHLQEMADIGFRIYQTEDFGIVFGIDGAGYNFYGTEEDPSHWIKLYKLRGLRWHKE